MPRLRVINADQVTELLTADLLRPALERALQAQAAGGANVPPRIAAHAKSGLLSAMPGYLEDTALITKLVSVFPDNVDLPTHMGVIVYFDMNTGLPLALIDGEIITRDRTACTASIAADQLTRSDAEVLTIVGVGVQGQAHLSFFRGLRDWKEIRVVSRRVSAAQQLIDQSGVPEAVATDISQIEDAVQGSDAVVLCTHSQSSVIDASWVRPGTHVSSVGSFAELPQELLQPETVVVVDHLGAVETPPPAGAVELQSLDSSEVVALGALLSGAATGRTRATEVTVYKSTGHAVQDIAAARIVYDRALAENVGIDIDL